MKAQVINDFNTPYSLEDVPTPEPQDSNDILLRVHAAGYCHTDGMMSRGERKPDPPEFPHINSHEIAGEIVGFSTTTNKPSPHAQTYSIGDRVLSTGRPFHPCGNCFECLDISSPDADEGYSAVCPHCKLNGMSKAGGFAEYVVVDARQIARIPDNVKATDAAPMSCAGITIYGALKRAGLRAGQRVAIVGCGGGLGHLGLQFADAMGLRALGIDAADGPLALAEGLGTRARIVDARSEGVTADALAREMAREDGIVERAEMGVDASIILVESQKGFDLGFDLIKNHGTCVVVSYAEAGFRVRSAELVYRDIRVVGTILGSNKMLREMMEVMAKHNIKPVTTVFPFEQLNELEEEYHKGKGGKFVLQIKS